MNQKKGITLVVSIVVSGCIFGVYSHQRTQAKEAATKQALITNIDKQQSLEDAARESKVGAPVVSEDYPAIPVAKIEVPSTKQDNSKSTANSISQNPGQAITALTESDIQRLQSYEQYSTDGIHGVAESYVSFQDMYTNERANCDGLIKMFSAKTLRDYSNAKVGWLTSPRLVYCSAIDQFCVRGILTLTFYEDGNKFGLTPNMAYQRDVEYRLRNSESDGKTILKLESTHYLSNFQAVK